MEFKQFFSEIKRSFRKYNETNLIDEMAVYGWVCEALKKFGTNIMDLHTTVIDIRNGKGSLPPQFHQLKSAVKCTPSHIKCRNKEEEKILYSSHVWRSIKHTEQEWDVCSGECYSDKETIKETVFTDNIYIDNIPFEKSYSKPQPLRLAKTFISDICTFDCTNSQRTLSDYEIMISGNTLYTNFTTGAVYIEYMGIRSDSNGMVEIPDTPKGELKKYIEYLVKRNILEEILVNGEDANIVTIFQYYNTMLSDQFVNAVVETKFNTLTPTSIYRMKERPRKDRERFETKMRKWS